MDRLPLFQGPRQETKSLSEDQNIAVIIKTRSRGLEKELERLVLSESGFCLGELKGVKRTDLLIYELGANVDKECGQIQSLLETNAVSEVFVISAIKESDLILKTMRAGVKEFIHLPLDEAELKNALLELKKRMKMRTPVEDQNQERAGRIINLMGAKGGVGTTTLAVNLAMTLAGKKEAGSVALVDLNMVFGEIPLFLSIVPAYHWGQIVENINRLDNTFLLNVMTPHKSGVRVLPSTSHLNGHPPLTPQIMERILATMKKTFDFIIVDTGQTLDGPTLKTIEMAERNFLITLLNLPCLHNTNNLLKSLSSTGAAQKDQVKLVANRYLKNNDIEIAEAEESVQSEIFWTVPNDYKTTMSAINRGKPLFEIAPKAKITKKIDGLVENILHGDREVKKRSWFSIKK
jgi:pilus assembly protein CpaE